MAHALCAVRLTYRPAMTAPSLLIIAALLLVLIARRRCRYVYAVLRRRRRRSDSGGYLYAFGVNGTLLPTVKIGRATDPASRLAAHRTAAPHGITVYCVLSVPCAIDAERLLHQRYRLWRVRGNGEWFYLHPLMFVELLYLRWRAL